MKPESPIIPGHNLQETIYAKDQPQYKPLPVYKSPDGIVLSRWRLSWMERLKVLFCGNVYLFVSTFNKPLQPINMQIQKPELIEAD